MALRVTSNWLVGLTRHPALVQRFPFMRTLANKYRVTSEGCSGCGQNASIKQFTNQANEVLKILATIPESEVQEFKRLAGAESLQIAYSDTRGRTINITR